MRKPQRPANTQQADANMCLLELRVHPQRVSPGLTRVHTTDKAWNCCASSQSCNLATPLCAQLLCNCCGALTQFSIPDTPESVACVAHKGRPRCPNGPRGWCPGSNQVQRHPPKNVPPQYVSARTPRQPHSMIYQNSPGNRTVY